MKREAARRRGALVAPRLAPEVLAAIRRKLLRWGQDNFQTYPWRTETSAWLTFVAEFLLQRTRAAQVADAYARIAACFPTPESLWRAARADAITSGLGLHFRGAQLIDIAREIDRQDGRIPESIFALQSFQGVGSYTASAWLSLHRNRRASIVDANIARWLSRLTGMPKVSDPRRVRWVRDLAETLTPRKRFRSYNYAVLDFTMTICTDTSPRCSECPIRGLCASRALESAARTMKAGAARNARTRASA